MRLFLFICLSIANFSLPALGKNLPPLGKRAYFLNGPNKSPEIVSKENIHLNSRVLLDPVTKPPADIKIKRQVKKKRAKSLIKKTHHKLTELKILGSRKSPRIEFDQSRYRPNMMTEKFAQDFLEQMITVEGLKQ